jgi:uncharacterized protein YfaS (alpha-2-macroglobulin family)
LKTVSPDGKQVWWEPKGKGTVFHGSGRAARIEATSLAVLATLAGRRDLSDVPHALAWLTEQKDPNGTWQSTQATVLALRALIEGTGQPLGADRERRIALELDGNLVRELVIPPEQGDVMQQVELSQFGPGRHRLTLTERSGAGIGYQAVFRHHVPQTAPAQKPDEPLEIDVAYDKTSLAVDDRVAATATVSNRTASVAPMIILDLPIPAGFAAEGDDFAQAVAKGLLEKYQMTPRSVIVYLRELRPGRPLALSYHLRATMPVKVEAAPARAYEYYNRDRTASGKPTRFTVAETR